MISIGANEPTTTVLEEPSNDGNIQSVESQPDYVDSGYVYRIASDDHVIGTISPHVRERSPPPKHTEMYIGDQHRTIPGVTQRVNGRKTFLTLLHHSFIQGSAFTAAVRFRLSQ